jgi:hypothetical protein
MVMDADNFNIFRLPKPEWTASCITVKSEKGWSVFYDGATRRQINRPRERAPDCRIPYRHKPVPDEDGPSSPRRPLESPREDNYCCFRARKRLATSECRVSDPRRITIPTDLDPPERHDLLYRKGEDPLRKPFRVSQVVVTQQKMAEAEQEQIRRLKHTLSLGGRRQRSDEIASPREPRTSSLFERSIKPKEDDVIYEWPRDFYHFQTEPTSRLSDHRWV